MKYVTNSLDDGLLIVEDKLKKHNENNNGGKKDIIKYGALEESGEDFVNGCYTCGCGCLSMIIGAGVLSGGLYWILS